jgi:hypothetical protein
MDSKTNGTRETVAKSMLLNQSGSQVGLSLTDLLRALLQSPLILRIGSRNLVHSAAGHQVT